MPSRALHHHDPFRGNRLRALPRIAEDELDGRVHVLAYVDRYPPFVNAGAEWMLHAMLRDSVRLGHRVQVATGCVDREHDVEGVEVYPARAGARLAADAHVVVSHLLWTNEAIRLATGAELPLLYLVHNDNQVRYWRLSAAKVSAYVWNSEWVSRACADHGGALDVPTIVVRPPLIADDYAVAHPEPADRPHITLVNPIKAKGADLFYRLAEREPDRSFLAVEGAYGHQQRPRRHQNVRWQRQTGRFRDDVLARTRVLLVPSSYESWGRVAVEAFAAGVPVIAAPTPGLREALGESWPLFADFDDDDAWLAALRELDDPERYDELSAAALDRADELDEVASSDLNAWDSLLRRAAAGTLSRMAGHDPFRAKSATVEAAAPAPAPKTKAAPKPLRVPDKAADVVAWLDNARTAKQRADRAAAALAVEQERAKPRKSVLAAVG